MKINFTKMHGIGNDYIYVNCMDSELENPGKISIEMSPRHFSVGSDGLIMICRSNVADVKMRMFNADGSEGKMCGNGIRCVGKFVYDSGISKKTELIVETLSGIKTLKLEIGEDGTVSTVRVNMGKYSTVPQDIPVKSDKPMISEKIKVAGGEYRITAVSMGNPHAICYLDDIKNLDLEKIGPSFEKLELFPESVNTEFVRIIDSKTLEMRVWERGSGETYACGTGACAVAASSILNGICKRGEEITVKLIGGELRIVVGDDNTVYMRGSATKVYDGIYDYKE